MHAPRRKMFYERLRSGNLPAAREPPPLPDPRRPRARRRARRPPGGRRGRAAGRRVRAGGQLLRPVGDVDRQARREGEQHRLRGEHHSGRERLRDPRAGRRARRLPAARPGRLLHHREVRRHARLDHHARIRQPFQGPQGLERRLHDHRHGDEPRARGGVRHRHRLARHGSSTPAAATQFGFQDATGCADPPEAEIDATGTTFKGATPTAASRARSTRTRTSRPSSSSAATSTAAGRGRPYGVTYALPDCASIQGLAGLGAPVQNFLDYGAPVAPHDTVGWPTFKDWPGPRGLTYEGDYYTGLKRAWMGGLRIFVTDLVDNEALCRLMTDRSATPVTTWTRAPAGRGPHELQDYIDAQSGGPGKGFFRIVTNPFQARKVINEGKLAVVEGVEVSHGSSAAVRPTTSGLLAGRSRPPASTSSSSSGSRSFFPSTSSTTRSAGRRWTAAAEGVLINGAQPPEDRPLLGRQDVHRRRARLRAAQPGRRRRAGRPARRRRCGQLVPGGTVPVYGPAPHCNQQGLTDLGSYLLSR